MFSGDLFSSQIFLEHAQKARYGDHCSLAKALKMQPAVVKITQNHLFICVCEIALSGLNLAQV
jgi:hypothetical protein